jgi:hypothetical protein
MASSSGGAMAADPQAIFIERLGVEPELQSGSKPDQDHVQRADRSS